LLRIDAAGERGPPLFLEIDASPSGVELPKMPLLRLDVEANLLVGCLGERGEMGVLSPVSGARSFNPRASAKAAM
jgi:hypothetical protein